MKKTVLMFLLLSSLILPGCGPYEDEGPKVVMTIPANGGSSFLTGGKVSVTFNTAMNPLSLGDSTNFVIADQFTGLSGGGIYDHSPVDLLPVEFNYDVSTDATTVSIYGTNAYLIDSCFILTVSENVMSADNVKMGTPYTSCFCTVDAAFNTCP